jgi:hypothetical protein
MNLNLLMKYGRMAVNEQGNIGISVGFAVLDAVTEVF